MRFLKPIRLAIQTRAIVTCVCGWLTVAAASELPSQAPRLLKQVLVSDSIEEAQQLTPSLGRGLVVIAPQLGSEHTKELTRLLGPGKDRPIDEPLLAAIAQVVENYFRQKDYPVAVAVIPPQSISEGAVRIAVLLGKIRDIKVEGNRWFSESLLREKLRVERGHILKISELDDSLTWTNSSPFRRVRLRIDAIPNTNEADLVFAVQEQRPLRLSASMENTGNQFIGKQRYAVGATVGNLWGHDHQFTYQYLTTDQSSVFRGHAIDYRAPLSWRHILVVTANYVDVKPTLVPGLIKQEANSQGADLRYVIPFKKGKWQGEFSGSVALKRTNNNFEFGGTPVVVPPTDVFGVALSAAAARTDIRGRWIVTSSVFGSPGTINDRTTREAYNESEFAANPRFAHVQMGFERQTSLSPKTTSVFRGAGQLASSNLLPSERLSLGGFSTIRGYEERILSGDSGFTLTHELQRRLPSISLPKKLPRVDTAALFFVEYGKVVIKRPKVGQNRSDYLFSAGFGVRAALPNNFSAALDYGRQIEEVEIPGEAHHRVHMRLTLAY